MPTPRRLALAAAARAAAACAARRIPNTDIRDTADNRAIYSVIEAYGQAMRNKDAAAVLALVAPDYFDDAGTPDPSDDLDRAKLERALPADFAKLQSVRLELQVRSIESQKDAATAEVYYDASYDIQTPGGEVVPRRESDVHRMRFRKIDGQWKIASGL